MLIAVEQFKGELPRSASRALPDGYAEAAVNTRLLSADLQPWRDNLFVLDLPKVGIINAVHLMFRQYWLHWTTSELAAGQVSVDVVLGAVPADASERTYFTGTIGGPRVTNVVGATVPGSGGTYPYQSYKLGVTAPTVAATVNEGLFLGGFKKSAFYDGSSLGAFTVSNDVTIDGAVGNPAPSFKLNTPFGGPAASITQQTSNGSLESFAYRFDVRNIGVFFSSDILFSFGCDSAGNGFAVQIDQSITIGNAIAPGMVGTGTFSPVSKAASGVFGAGGGFVRVTVVAQVVGENTQIAVSILNSAGTLIGQSSATVPGKPRGENVTYFNGGSNFNYAINVDNIVNFDGGYESLATNYVYTFVNVFDEEGAPSPPTPTIGYGLGETIQVSGIADPSPTDVTERGIVKKYLYRAATSDSGTQYQFVAEIAVGVTSYTDTKTDAQLGEPLESELYELPPVDGFSIISLPNGVTVMASKNQVCPSVQNRPHAYPLVYRLTTANQIVALGSIDTNIIVATEGGIQIVSGTDPSRLSMSDPLLPQGCVSKRSLSSLLGFGVMYASQNGLVGVNAVGGASIATESVISEQEWQRLNPSSIIAATHDDRYYGFYDNGVTQGGFIFDPKQGGNGWSWLDFYAQAVFNDPRTDSLYLVIANELYKWDGAATSRPYRWRSKLYQLPRGANLRACQVRASDYINLTLRLYENGTLFYTRAVTSDMEFVLPAVDVTQFQFELAGTSRVNSVQFAEDMDELS